MSAKKKNKEISYQEALEELESIVGEIEEDSMDVDSLSEKVSRAFELIEHCRGRLRNTENTIQQAFEQEDNPEE